MQLDADKYFNGVREALDDYHNWLQTLIKERFEPSYLGQMGDTMEDVADELCQTAQKLLLDPETSPDLLSGLERALAVGCEMVDFSRRLHHLRETNPEGERQTSLADLYQMRSMLQRVRLLMRQAQVSVEARGLDWAE